MTASSLLPRRAIILFFYGRSGSTFIDSLLDSHPYILNFPASAIVSFHPIFWKEHGGKPANELITTFLRHYPEVYKRSAKKNPSIFILKMREMLEGVTTISSARFLQAAFIAFNMALGRKVIPEKSILFFHLHDPNMVVQTEAILNDFQDTLMLYMIRDPIQSLGSHFAHYYVERKSQNIMQLRGHETLEWILQGILLRGIVPVNEYAQRCRAIRFEDAKLHPEKTLRGLCAWLEIPWDDILLSPTKDGEPDSGMETSTGRIQGFDRAALYKQHKEYITPFDRFRFRVLTAPKYRFWGYKLNSFYSWKLTRWLTFPLLLLSTRMERLLRQTTWKRYEFIDSGGSRIPGYNVYQVWLRLRLLLVTAWQSTFFEIREEVPVLEESPTSGYAVTTENIASALIREAVALVCAKEFDAGYMIVRDFIKRNPTPPEKIYLILGRITQAMLENELRPDLVSEVMSLFDKAMVFFPKNTDIRFVLGQIHLTLKNTQSAEQCFASGLAIDPDHVDILREMALLKMNDPHRINEAREHLLALVRMKIDDVNAWSLLGLIAKSRGDHDLQDTACFQVKNYQPDHHCLPTLEKKAPSS
ncbi:MAG: hypothetical protein HW380_3992 [Magnetococcales bacterium]|nr:hypothetical protein [Magnetococcales bacterium]